MKVLRWAKHGITRVVHVLDATSTRVLEFEELCTHHPDLVGRGATRACVKRMFTKVRSNLHRWQPTLTKGPGPGVQQGQFRHTRTGQLLRARQAVTAGDTTVPAWVCETEPQTGAIRVTEEQAALPASSARQSASRAPKMRQQTTRIRLLQARRRKTPNWVAPPPSLPQKLGTSGTRRSPRKVPLPFRIRGC